MIQLELGFGALLTLWLVVAAGVTHPLTQETAFVTGGLALVTAWAGGATKPNVKRLFYVARYGFVLWAYLATARLVPALQRVPRDADLLGLDRALFGETPALAFDSARHPLLTEVLTAGYLAYQPYLHLCLLWALLEPVDRAPRLARLVFSTLIFGYIGYLLVPAVGPFAAIPALASAPLEHGPLARLNLDIVKRGGAVFDVFPSLHTAVTLVLLAHDRERARWRFRVMLPIAAVLIPATMLLRFHYVVDVLAGVALAAGVWGTQTWGEKSGRVDPRVT
jgi:membrane-associated phospholipid phosphatase